MVDSGQGQRRSGPRDRQTGSPVVPTGRGPTPGGRRPPDALLTSGDSIVRRTSSLLLPSYPHRRGSGTVPRWVALKIGFDPACHARKTPPTWLSPRNMRLVSPHGTGP